MVAGGAYRRLLGDPLQQVLRLLGHSSLATTCIYLDHLTGGQETVDAAVEELLFGVETPAASKMAASAKPRQALATGAGGGSSQWTDGTAGAIYYNSGNVGIGTTSPTAKLEIKGHFKASGTSSDGTAMYYVGGSFTFAQAQTQCVTGYHTCTAQEFMGYMAVYHDTAKQGYGWSSVRALGPCNSGGDGNCSVHVGACGAGQAMLMRKEVLNSGTPYGPRGGAFCYTGNVASFGAFCCID